VSKYTRIVSPHFHCSPYLSWFVEEEEEEEEEEEGLGPFLIIAPTPQLMPLGVFPMEKS